MRNVANFEFYQIANTQLTVEPQVEHGQHIVVDLGFRGVDADNPGVEFIHRGKFKSLSKQQRGGSNAERRWSQPLGTWSPISAWIATGSPG